MFFIVSGVRWASMQKLLKEGEYDPIEKKRTDGIQRIGSASSIRSSQQADGMGSEPDTSNSTSECNVCPVHSHKKGVVIRILNHGLPIHTLRANLHLLCNDSSIEGFLFLAVIQSNDDFRTQI